MDTDSDKLQAFTPTDMPGSGIKDSGTGTTLSSSETFDVTAVTQQHASIISDTSTLDDDIICVNSALEEVADDDIRNGSLCSTDDSVPVEDIRLLFVSSDYLNVQNDTSDDHDAIATDEKIDNRLFSHSNIECIAKEQEQIHTETLSKDDNHKSWPLRIKNKMFAINHFSKKTESDKTEESVAKEKTRADHLKHKSKIMFKRFLVFMFSHVGLTCLVIAYSILGAIIFQKLEQWNEHQSRIVTTKLRKDMLDDLWNATKKFNILRKAPWTSQAEVILRSFERDIYKATKELGWDGISDEAVEELQWSFTGSLLYSVTVITTIGYGHITPKTTWGRIVTMIYAFFGIPLTLMCLANIGALMGKGLVILYNKIPVIRTKRSFGLDSALPIPQTVTNKEKIKSEDGTIVEESNILVYIPTRPTPPPKHVPVLVCFLLVIVYTLVGTTIFTIWEKGWDVLTSAYFCFITLSTIGFGDVVPGHSLDSWQSQPKQFICTIYLLFGLTLLAMCFDLLQDRVRTIARQFGEYIGIIEEEEEEEENDNPDEKRKEWNLNEIFPPLEK